MGLRSPGGEGPDLPIDFWDHEEPELEATAGSGDAFEAWLEARVDAAEAESREIDHAPEPIADDPGRELRASLKHRPRPERSS